MLSVAIIDDEPDARSILKSFLQDYCPDITVVGEAEDVPSGVALIRLSKPDIILLDIHLKKELGFDILDKFANPSFRIIFTTAYDNYALKAFRYYALDYLLKPIDPNLLINAIDKAKEDIEKNRFFQEQLNGVLHSHRTQSFDKIALPSAEGVALMEISNILYLKSDGNYSLFFTADGEKIIVSKTLKEFEQILPKEIFIRVHNSYIINVQFVKKVLKEDGGYAQLSNDEKIPISRRKKDAFLKMIMK